ncbi:hypothetical protein AcW1_002379 [Taiwanofungus camphoratus]|nr:hypothetical protein AcW1_002379 [Antrodia cinnamomea]
MADAGLLPRDRVRASPALTIAASHGHSAIQENRSLIQVNTRPTMVRETKRQRDIPKASIHASSASSARFNRPDSSREDDTYSSLQLLGAPELSREEFGRLCKGPLADILFFVAEHVKGRKETAAARVAIFRMHESGNTTRVGGGTEGQSSYMKLKASNARLTGAKGDLKVVQEDLAKRHRSLIDLQREADNLQAAMGEKRLTSSLLEVLEKKESIRSARFTEIGRLLERLDKCVPGTIKTNEDGESVLLTKLPPPRRRIIRVENTRDVLAALQAYHVRLSRTSTRDSAAQEKICENRLRRAIAKATDLPEDDERVGTAYEKCRLTARHRASRSIRYCSPLQSCSPNPTCEEIDLDVMQRQSFDKEQALQHVSDASIALGLACAQSLHNLATFVNQTAPALRESLRGEAAAAQGYVDVLRLSVVNRATASTKKADDDSTVHDLAEGKAWSQVLEDVQTSIEQACERETFLNGAKLGDHANACGSGDLGGPDELIAAHARRQDNVGERLRSLLSRKLEKARAGDVLVDDVERLAAEVGIITALGGSSRLG